MSLIMPNEKEVAVKVMQESLEQMQGLLKDLAMFYQDPEYVKKCYSYYPPDTVFSHLICALLSHAIEIRKQAADFGYPWVAIKQKDNKLNDLIKRREKCLIGEFSFLDPEE